MQRGPCTRQGPSGISSTIFVSCRAACSVLPDSAVSPIGQPYTARDLRRYGNAAPAIHPAAQSPAFEFLPTSTRLQLQTAARARPSRADASKPLARAGTLKFQSLPKLSL